MSAALLALASTFGLILVAELPDKTMVATLVLTTRFRARAVLIGVAAAFALQTVVAVAFGSALTLLPDSLVAAIVAVMFGVGSFLLLREGFRSDEESGEDAARSGPGPVTFLRSALTSFGVLFAAEWGDASQLATAGLAARYGEPIAVGIGAFAAMLTVAGIAVFIGHKARGRLRPRLLQRAAGILFAGFAVFALWQTFAG